MTEILYRGSLLYAYYDVNVYFFQIFCKSYFFGQIWSQNLKFSTLTEIYLTLQHAYYDFDIYCFKSLSFK